MQNPPPRYGTRKNPVTGKTETYELPPEVDLAKSRKDLADVLHGGGWFEDPLAKPKEHQAQQGERDIEEVYGGYMYGDFGDLE